MNEALIDWGFLEELSGGDSKYKYEVISIFLESVDEGLKNLQELINQGKDYEAIFKQAHALKSSAGIIKVHQMYERLAEMEMLARNIAERGAKEGQQQIADLFSALMTTYDAAHIELDAALVKHKPAS